MADNEPKDHWTAKAYSASASFVPELATTVVSWLNPQPTDRILDLGCGDGVLTAKIASRCESIAGLDSSANLISAAEKSYGSSQTMTWHVEDCRYLEHSASLRRGFYTKVFSNAALHWILRDPSTRLSVLKSAYESLESGGSFALEMGGAGNVADVHTALLAAVVHQGLSIPEAHEASPWFFPSEKLMAKLLGEAGFTVEKSELEYRPTELTTGEEGGLEGWVRLMGAQILEKLNDESKREAAVREVCGVLKRVCTHEEDGTQWLGYVRLRVLAKKN